MKTDKKTKSRLQILSHIMQFSLSREINGHAYGGLNDMRFRENLIPSIGSLVALSCAPASEWYLSWVRKVDFFSSGCSYTLESIETGEVCEWTNVSIFEYDTSQTQKHPEWKWTDQQHAFEKRWKVVCFQDMGAYIMVPCMAEFNNNNAVSLGFRVTFGLDEWTYKKTFDDWRKVTKKVMKEFYIEAEKNRESLKVKQNG